MHRFAQPSSLVCHYSSPQPPACPLRRSPSDPGGPPRTGRSSMGQIRRDFTNPAPPRARSGEIHRLFPLRRRPKIHGPRAASGSSSPSTARRRPASSSPTSAGNGIPAHVPPSFSSGQDKRPRCSSSVGEVRSTTSANAVRCSPILQICFGQFSLELRVRPTASVVSHLPTSILGGRPTTEDARFQPPAPPHADALDDNSTTAPEVATWPSQSCPCATPWTPFDSDLPDDQVLQPTFFFLQFAC
ncbi:hypothetical protein VPH35_137988 [Triticum aestivum]